MIDLSHYKPTKNNKKIIFMCSKIYDFQIDEGFGGIGDRMVGLISSFVLAILLNYEFRIFWKFPIELDKIFYENSNICWNKKDYNLENIKIIRLMDNDIFDKNNQDLLINKIHNLIEDTTIISNKFFIYFLMKNNNFKERINLLNINETTVYRDAIHLLFNFNNSIQLKYEKILHTFSNYFTIGIQIRSYIDEYKIKLTDNDYIEYVNFIDNVIENNTNENFLLLICCDSYDTKYYFSKKYDNYKQILIDGDIMHLEKTKDYNTILNNNIKLFLEIWGLGKCNELIVTYSSNFGRLAALRTLKFPKLGYKLISPNPNNYNPDTFKMSEINYEKKKNINLYNLLTKDNLYNYTNNI